MDKGVYGFSEAARLARVDAANTRRWFLGRRDHPTSGPVLRSDVPSVDGQHAISFLDLIDLRVVGRFRERGISMPTVRKVYSALSRKLKSPHPFAHARLVVFGKTVMEQVAEEDGEVRLREVLTGQEAIHKLLEKFLRDVEYRDEDGLAVLWHAHRGVVIDPRRNLGKPIAEEGGAGTFVLARAYAANDENAELVADLFHTTPRAVLNAVAFEEWAAQGGRTAA
jgi:uncharacterized protein (DUF433 family)